MFWNVCKFFSFSNQNIFRDNFDDNGTVKKKKKPSSFRTTMNYSSTFLFLRCESQVEHDCVTTTFTITIEIKYKDGFENSFRVMRTQTRLQTFEILWKFVENVLTVEFKNMLTHTQEHVGTGERVDGWASKFY